jgi:hypothetical protein
MPNRPPKGWMDRCEAEVRAHGGAVDVGAVCAAVWKRKSPAEKRAIVAMEEGMKKGHHSGGRRRGKLHGAALRAHEKKLAREHGHGRKKKGGGALHGAALAAHERRLTRDGGHHSGGVRVTGVRAVEATLHHAEHQLHQLAKHPHGKKTRHPACAVCGHDRRFHSAKVGCAHNDGHKFCSCSSYIGRHH